MKLFLQLYFSSLYLIGCSSEVNTDENDIKRTITITEYHVVNNDFDSIEKKYNPKEWVRKYDKNNVLIEEVNYWGLVSRFGNEIKYKYDKENKKIEEFVLNVHKNTASRFTFEYYKDSVIQFEIEHKDQKIKRRKDYFDSNYNLIRETTFLNDGKIISDYYFKYNSKNQQIERIGRLDFEKVQVIYKKYDSLANLIEQTSIDTNGVVLSVEKFFYTKFDINGNWEVRKRTLDGLPNSIAFQKIEIK